MARMIGKTLRFRQCPYECCGVTQDKHTVKIREKIHALRFEDIADADDHAEGLCSNEKTGMLGCEFCYGEDYEHYDNAELDNIEGVWCNTDWREV